MDRNMEALDLVGRAFHYGTILTHYVYRYPRLRRKVRAIMCRRSSEAALTVDGHAERGLPGSSEHRRYGYHRYMMARYLYAIPFIRGKDVLEVGCGLGWGAHLISEYPANVTCIDRSEVAIAYARREWQDPAVEYTVRSVEDLNSSGQTYDVVLAYELIEHLEVEVGRALVREIARLLRPEGAVIMSSYFPDHDWQARQAERMNPFHPHIYTKGELSQLLVDVGITEHRFKGNMLLVARKAGQLASTEQRGPH